MSSWLSQGWPWPCQTCTKRTPRSSNHRRTVAAQFGTAKFEIGDRAPPWGKGKLGRDSDDRRPQPPVLRKTANQNFVDCGLSCREKGRYGSTCIIQKESQSEKLMCLPSGVHRTSSPTS